MLRRTMLASCVAAAGLGALDAAAQQPWPQKPVRIIVSLPAGSGVDAMARILGDTMSKNWGQAAVVENHPGGQNVIGAVAAARSPADGYTFYLSTAAALVTNRYLFSSLPYDPFKDFAPVGMIGTAPFAFFVKASSPFNTLDDLVRAARQAPGKVSIAIEGPKTFGGITARLFNSQAKIDTNLVSYVSVGTAVQDVIGGHTVAVICDVASNAQLVRQGVLKALAVTSARRIADWPQVASVSETIPGFDMVGWVAVVAPAGTPVAIVERFNKDLDLALRRPEVGDKIRLMGFAVDGAGKPDQMTAFMKAEDGRWQGLSKEIGLLPE